SCRSRIAPADTLAGSLVCASSDRPRVGGWSQPPPTRVIPHYLANAGLALRATRDGLSGLQGSAPALSLMVLPRDVPAEATSSPPAGELEGYRCGAGGSLPSEIWLREAPPSTAIVWPLICPASSPERKATAAAISAGSTSLPVGPARSTRSRTLPG